MNVDIEALGSVVVGNFNRFLFNSFVFLALRYTSTTGSRNMLVRLLRAAIVKGLMIGIAEVSVKCVLPVGHGILSIDIHRHFGRSKLVVAFGNRVVGLGASVSEGWFDLVLDMGGKNAGTFSVSSLFKLRVMLSKLGYNTDSVSCGRLLGDISDNKNMFINKNWYRR